MEHTIEKIESKPSDYILCSCGRINWHERTHCVDCNELLSLETMSEEQMEMWYNEEYDFWKFEGYIDKEINNINIEI